MKQTVAAEAILETLWRRQASRRPSGRPASPPSGRVATPPYGRLAAPDQAQVAPLAQALGEQAMQCVADAIAQRHDALVDVSASIVETLVSLWAACGLAPDEIWVELHKREQLGSLLMQLNQAQAEVPRRLLKPWRVDSTKLP